MKSIFEYLGSLLANSCFSNSRPLRICGREINGGGVAKMGNLLFQPAIKVVRGRAFSTLANTVEIKPAILRDDSGVLGAVASVLEHSA